MGAPASHAKAGALHFTPPSMTHATLADTASDAHAAASVTLRVVYLARLREALGAAGETLVLARREPTTVADVVAMLRARGGAFAQELAPGRAFRVALNHALAAHDAPLRDGDEVAFLPPVTGG